MKATVSSVEASVPRARRRGPHCVLETLVQRDALGLPHERRYVRVKGLDHAAAQEASADFVMAHSRRPISESCEPATEACQVSGRRPHPDTEKALASPTGLRKPYSTVVRPSRRWRLSIGLTNYCARLVLV